MTRVVVVLGYSDGRTDGLHPVCAARLHHAAGLSTAEDVVVLSGWARHPGRRSEAELMRDAWRGACARLVVDPDARTTTENARNALDDVTAAGVREVVVVTSAWHAARARAAFRWLLRGRGVVIATSSPPGGTRADRVREAALWPLLPAQLLGASPPRALRDDRRGQQQPGGGERDPGPRPG